MVLAALCLVSVGTNQNADYPLFPASANQIVPRRQSAYQIPLSPLSYKSSPTRRATLLLQHFMRSVVV